MFVCAFPVEVVCSFEELDGEGLSRDLHSFYFHCISIHFLTSFVI